VLLLSFNLSGLGGPTRSIKTPTSIAIRVNEVHNPPYHVKMAAHGGYRIEYFFKFKSAKFADDSIYIKFSFH